MRFSRRSVASSLFAASNFKPASTFARQSGGVAGITNHPISSVHPLLNVIPTDPWDDVLDVTWFDAERQIIGLAGSLDVPPQARNHAIVKTQVGNTPHYLTMARRIEIYMGFGLLQISRMVVSGRYVETIHVIELNLPASKFTRFWESAGYERRENEFGTFWTIDEFGKTDLAQPVQAAVYSFFNNITILEDNVIALAGTSAQLATIMEAHQRDTPSGYADLLSVSAGVPDDAISGWYQDASVLSNFKWYDVDGPELLAESDDAVGPMPILRTICIGTTAGTSYDESVHLDSARTYLAMEAETPGTAGQIARVIEWRMPEMVSILREKRFADLLPDMQVDVVNDRVVRVSASGRAAQSSAFGQHVSFGDIAPFAFIAD